MSRTLAPTAVTIPWTTRTSPPLSHGLSSQTAALGIALCGTGIGASIAAVTKVHGIRCALVHDRYTARMAKEHNNANVLALGGRTTAEEIALECVMTWLNATYQGGRHQPRIDKISALESEPQKN